MLMILKIFVMCLVFSTEAQIPDFIIPCREDEPDLNACALKNARIAIPELVKGYRPYNLPKLSPLSIPKIDIQAGNNLQIELSDNKVYGLENTWITDTDFHLKEQHLVFKVSIPMANIVGHYKMNGRILILPINGEGPANLTLITDIVSLGSLAEQGLRPCNRYYLLSTIKYIDISYQTDDVTNEYETLNGKYVYSMDFILVPRDGEEYLTITNHNITFTTTRAYFHFENLFNGDTKLENQMNTFLDENWKEVTKDLGYTVAETISSIITAIAQNIFSQVPFKEVFIHN